MDCSTPGFPVLHHLPELAQPRVHWVGDATQSSHPLLSPSPPAFNLSQHQGVFSNELVLCIRWPKYGASASASVLAVNIQDWFPLRFTGLILQSKGVSRVFSNTTVQKHQCFSTQPSLWSNSHNHAGKTIALTRRNFVGKVMSAFYTLSRFVIAFLPSSKHLLISWLQSQSAVILEPPKIKSFTVSIVSPSICNDGTGCQDLFLNVEF